MALGGSDKQHEPNQKAVDVTERPSDGAVEILSCTKDVHHLLLTYSDAFTLARSDLLGLSLAGSIASLETTSRTAAVFDHLTSTKDPYIDSHPSTFKSRATRSVKIY